MAQDGIFNPRGKDVLAIGKFGTIPEGLKFQSRPGSGQAYVISKGYANYLYSIWLSGIPQGSVLVYFLSCVIVGKAFCFAGSSRST